MTALRTSMTRCYHAGVAKECARDVTLAPLEHRQQLYMHGNLRSWMHYVPTRGVLMALRKNINKLQMVYVN